jgi:hypothetical protein
MPTSNIDDVLMGGKSTIHPETPEHKEAQKEINAFGDIEGDTLEYEESVPNKSLEESEPYDNEPDDNENKEARAYIDDYGNEEEPVNDTIRERLARQAKKYETEIDNLRAQLAAAGASREVQQAASDFEYDPDAEGDWKKQFASLVKETVHNMSREEEHFRSREIEAKIQYEFETKLRQGMQKFDDFSDVIKALPFEITNPMTMATRAMSDPAAFLYAAAKRQPAELERIAKIRDPYAQMTEIGRLEERMRRNKSTTNAPRPPGRAVEDSASPETKKKSEPSIEDLIARADAKKLAKRKSAPRMGRR